MLHLTHDVCCMSVSVTAVGMPEWLWQTSATKSPMCKWQISWSQQCSSYYTIICFSCELAAPVLLKSLCQNTLWHSVTACIHPPSLELTTCVRLCCRLLQPVCSRNPWCRVTSLCRHVFENVFMLLFFSCTLPARSALRTFSFEVSLFSKGGQAARGWRVGLPARMTIKRSHFIALVQWKRCRGCWRTEICSY